MFCDVIVRRTIALNLLDGVCMGIEFPQLHFIRVLGNSLHRSGDLTVNAKFVLKQARTGLMPT